VVLVVEKVLEHVISIPIIAVIMEEEIRRQVGEKFRLNVEAL
jgi:hypothetical protein